MKQITSMLLMGLLAITAVAQPLTSSDYLRKSRHQQTAGAIFASAGLVIVITGIVTASIFSTRVTVNGSDWGPIVEDRRTNAITSVIVIAGVCSIIGSMPYFISAKKNKRRASQFDSYFKMENYTDIRKQYMARVSYPALAIRLSL